MDGEGCAGAGVWDAHVGKGQLARLGRVTGVMCDVEAVAVGVRGSGEESTQGLGTTPAEAEANTRPTPG